MLPYYEPGSHEQTIEQDFHVNHWQSVLDWPPHIHPQIEMIYVRRGTLEVSIDAQTQVLKEGDFAVAFPHCIHSYRALAGQRENADIYFYIVNAHMTGDYADRITTYIPREPFVRRHNLPTDAHIALERLTEQYRHYHPSITKAYLQIVLADTWGLLRPERNDMRDQDLPYQALRYISEHFQQPITAESVARALCVSKSNLFRMFSQKLHITLHQYLNFLRVEAARDMLRNTDCPIMAVVYECGFESPRTFNRVFLEICGITPRQYRAGIAQGK